MIAEFKHPLFITGVIGFLVTVFVYILGNPTIDGFVLHWIPEMFSLYALGGWTVIVKWRFFLVVFVYVSSTIVVPVLIVYGGELCWGLVTPVLIGLPYILGYSVASLKLRNKKIEGIM